ncbi:hypothetical protein [Roseibium sp. MMSF_3544]|uniref:hypothetical protein n=1 Tax=unclassified Roseibium TaxID=2629323 RepID=UPI00273F1F85|nr:hypothetical protein [Roseibium sp. MMSF_3544]
MAWTTLLGIALLVWVAYDLVTGKVWLHRAFHRASEPAGYWLTMGLWLLVALSCFYWGGFG